MADGATRDDATRMALRDFGGVERHKEDARDALGLRILDDIGRDFQYAVRLLGRNPGFTIAATALRDLVSWRQCSKSATETTFRS